MHTSIPHRSRDWRRDAVHHGKFLRFVFSSFRLDTSMLVHVRDAGSIESSACVFPVPTYFRATFDEELFHNLYHFTSLRIRVVVWSFEVPDTNVHIIEQHKNMLWFLLLNLMIRFSKSSGVPQDPFQLADELLPPSM